jgi:hypothetical protein
MPGQDTSTLFTFFMLSIITTSTIYFTYINSIKASDIEKRLKYLEYELKKNEFSDKLVKKLSLSVVDYINNNNMFSENI